MVSRIERILESKVTTEEKVDKLLQYDCELRTELGLESTLEERKEVTKLSDQIMKAIVKLDPKEKYLTWS